MQLVHVEVQLDFTEQFRSYSIPEQLHRALTGRLPSAPVSRPELGTSVRALKAKQMVVWDSTSCRIIAESLYNPADTFSKIVDLFDRVNKVAPMRRLSRRQFVTFWLLPAENNSFRELEQKYRNTLIIDHRIWRQVFDSSIVADIRVGNLVMHHQSGPMKPTQLKDDFLVFKLENIPKTFLFLWVSVHAEGVVQYSRENTIEFMTTSFKHCEEHSKLFEGIWRGVL